MTRLTPIFKGLTIMKLCDLKLSAKLIGGFAVVRALATAQSLFGVYVGRRD